MMDYTIGDIIRVVSGELKGHYGIVLDADGSIFVEIQKNDEGKGIHCNFSEKQIEKIGKADRY